MEIYTYETESGELYLLDNETMKKVTGLNKEKLVAVENSLTLESLRELNSMLCKTLYEMLVPDGEKDILLAIKNEDNGDVLVAIRKSELSKVDIVSCMRCNDEDSDYKELSFDTVDKAFIDMEYNVQMLRRIKYGFGSETITKENIEGLEIKGCYDCGTEFNSVETIKAKAECCCPKCGAQFLKNRYTWKLSSDTDWNRRSFMTLNECYKDAVSNGLNFGEQFDRGQLVHRKPKVDLKEIIDSVRYDCEYEYLDLDFLNDENTELMSSCLGRIINDKFNMSSYYDVNVIYETESRVVGK
jgi:DNA-directed RNA polymerase subunit RPC12/RpoP